MFIHSYFPHYAPFQVQIELPSMCLLDAVIDYDFLSSFICCIFAAWSTQSFV